MHTVRHIAAASPPESVFRVLRGRGPAVWLELGPRRVGLASLTHAERPVGEPPRVSGAAPGAVPPEIARLPFVSGWVGWYAYEAAGAFDAAPPPPPPRPIAGAPFTTPPSWLGRAEATAWWDGQAWAVAGRPEAVDALVDAVYAATPLGPAPPATGRRVGEGSRERFEAGVRRVKEHLRAGDCYQVNLSRHVDLVDVGDPFDAWRRLRVLNPARRGMYLETPHHQVISNSPELLLRARPTPEGLHVRSTPIKGTAPWDCDPIRRAEAAQALLASAKERAELTMIVDLVRADLGWHAVPGSVCTGPRRVGRVGHVLHAVRTVEARMPPGVTAADVFARLFPAGSVTGAPRLRAMEVIASLEEVPRGVYCGSLGWFGDDGSARWNVAIRTITAQGARARFHVGAGLVIGSEPAREYEETVLKAARLAQALEAS